MQTSEKEEEMRKELALGTELIFGESKRRKISRF